MMPVQALQKKKCDSIPFSFMFHSAVESDFILSIWMLCS